MNQSLAAEWGKYNMRFVMVSPGPIYTEGAFSRLDPLGVSNIANPNDRAAVGKSVPLGRMASPEEYAKFVSFVASSDAKWLTGTNIYFDGGSFANGGEFAALKQVSRAEWQIMEQTIRKNNAKQKKGDITLKAKV